MPNYRNAKELMAEMYPVKMAAGGIIGNIGLLQTAALSAPRIDPALQDYLKQYEQYQNTFNTEYLPEYEKFAKQHEDWATQYNNVADALNRGAYDVRVDKNSKKRRRAYQALGYTVVGSSSNHYYWRPPSVETIFKSPEPRPAIEEPPAPTLPKGIADPEGVQLAIQQQAQNAQSRGKALNVFADPRQYNLAGFAGSSTFNEPEAREFFAKGGEVDKFIAKNRK
jgi:hypothetical protein